jgi:hypothetical protein
MERNISVTCILLRTALAFSLIVAVNKINGDAESDNGSGEAPVIELHAGVNAQQNVGDSNEDRGNEDDKK